MELNLVQSIAIYALPVIFAITLHEAAHGYVAKQCGDMTAYREGRVSLLPHCSSRQVARIEPYGFYILILLLFTGALGFVLWPAIGALLARVAGMPDLPVTDLFRLTGLA